MALGREGAEVVEVDLLLGEAVGEEANFGVEVGVEVVAPGGFGGVEVIGVHCCGDFADEGFEVCYDLGFGLGSGRFEFAFGDGRF